MAAIWDPRTLLEIDLRSIAPCVGTTLKNTRCKQSYLFFSTSKLNRASCLLDEMSQSQPVSSRANLRLLAEYTLCPRLHCNSQIINKVASDWWATICASYPNGIVPATTNSRSRQYGSEEQAHTRRRNVSQTARPYVAAPTPPRSPSPAPHAVSADLARIFGRSVPMPNTTPVVRSSAHAVNLTVSSRSRITTRLLTPPASPSARGSRSLAPSPTDVGSEEESEEESEDESEEETEGETHEEDSDEEGTPKEEEIPEEEVEDRTTRASLTSAEASSIPTPPATPRRARSPTAAATFLPLTPEPTQPKPCPHSSRRKPLKDDCPICNEQMHCLDDAVWCRAQCGQNMHRSCFAPWRTDCLDREAPVTCVYCRAQWKFEWED